MTELDLQATLDGVSVTPEIVELRPDYRGLLIAVDGLEGGPTDEAAEASLREAEEAAREALSDTAPEQIPDVAAWREAYRSIGAKPQRTRNSLEVLLRRAAKGLPRIDRLTDTYNAISVLHFHPLRQRVVDHGAIQPGWAHLEAATQVRVAVTGDQAYVPSQGADSGAAAQQRRRLSAEGERG